MKTLTAVLFAGGESRRMGADKATLIIHGEPLWSRQLRLLQTLGAERVMVSARRRPAWCPPEINVVLDAEPSRGPLSGLAAVLATITTTHALVLALDLPRIKAEVLHKLWADCETGRGAISSHDGFIEPLCAIYPAVATHLVNTALTGEDFSMRGIIGKLLAAQLMKAMPIEATDRSCFLNLNTLADVSALKYSLMFESHVQDGGGGGN